QQGEAEVNKIIESLVQEGIRETELEKVKNQSETSFEVDEVEVISRAMNLAFASLSGDTARVNKERAMVSEISTNDIQRVAKEILKEENSSVMYYKSALN
ncbi:MAG: insulinase family protein, partial [Cyclobacteriaceae bacterium]|nr:insulinase family protein [Cyclobacteriaceae bacterium]